MHIEYEIINGVLCYRSGPKDKFKPVPLNSFPSLWRELNADNAALRAELEKAKERELTTCKWSPDPDDDTWNGDCGAKWTLEYDDPKTNGMNYCPVCGKRLEQVGDYSY